MQPIPTDVTPKVRVRTDAEPISAGPFRPDWGSLTGYQVPEWFRDAKFGIWAHWGPQCAPEAGDWYARGMYEHGSDAYQHHLAKYGHPSQVGFKEVIRDWKAERWDPNHLVSLYKQAGARVFFAMANHHDNFDLWDSKYQPWNSVAMGPKKDIIDGWARAAREQGLRFGVSVHAAHAWTWYEPSQGADPSGTMAGVPYDGNLTAADGKGTWWEGLDPQDLYAQNHPVSDGFGEVHRIHSQWHWGEGASQPDQAYCENFYNRTVDLINKYEPDLLYFDDSALPLWPASDAGLKIAAHYYNQSVALNGGRTENVIFGKILDDVQRRAVVWDVERGAPNRIEPIPWQTCTCIGGWHYKVGHPYKSAKTVVQILADVVSKNGCLLLSVPVRADGTIDDQATQIVKEIGDWMRINGKAIYDTRPWKVFGEGPAVADMPAMTGQGFNEGRNRPYTGQDLRFTTREGAIYVIAMERPAESLRVASFAEDTGLLEQRVMSVEMLGSSSAVSWRQDREGLHIEMPADTLDGCVAFKVCLVP